MLAGCDASALGQPAPTTAPAQLTMPNVVGQNADVAQDSLKKLGFTNIDLGTVDGHHVVVLPQNWTVRAQSAKSGSHLAPDAKIVLGCARIGGNKLVLPIP
jgi:beta-lactam-binding protein with PASTA domain